MYKILIADDEGIVIDSMKFIIEKEFPGEFELQTAKTGRSAIEIAESFRPDIAVMDIQMPGINGIDAMKEMRSNNANLVFIVMSAYDKFDYAQQAIALGVQEYITKPMDRKKVVAAIRRAMEQVSYDKEKRSNDLLVREKLETVIPILENGLIYNILLKDPYPQDIENYKSLLEIDTDYGFMMVLLSGEDQEGTHMTNAVGTGVTLQKRYAEIRDDFKEYFSECAVGGVMANRIAIFVPENKTVLEYNERIDLIEKCRRLVRNLRNKYNVRFRLGIGNLTLLTEMSMSYQDAVKALRMSTGSVAHADDLQLGCDYDSDYPVELERGVINSVNKGDVDASAIYAGNFFDWMASQDDSEMMNVKLKVLEFILLAEKAAYESGGMTYHFDSRKDYLPFVLEVTDSGELREWFVMKIQEASRNVASRHEEKSDNDIQVAKDYIEKNFGSNITLDDVSRIVNISPYYFSKVFKEETGENFIDYLTNLRIGRAKELLRNSDLSMKEICNEIGYADPNYFSRTFKKNVGVSPTEYKEGKNS